MDESNDLFLQRKKKFEELRDEGFPPYPNTFKPSDSIADLLSRYGKHTEDELKSLDVKFSLAGRLMRL
ncbi:MAG TPA: lysine--tRNA ligase, partial [Thermodesulfobacteriota bacterium]|nr:lysine--tRNA ligase [Thermodesulfobacteriota bacterium]